MTTTDILLIILTAMVVGSSIYIYLQRKDTGSKDEGQAMQLLQNQLAALTTQQNEKLDRTLKELNDRLNDQTKALNDQLTKSQINLTQQFSMSQRALRETSDSTQKIVKEVTEKLTKLDETNKQVVGFAEQLQSLENILKNPKQRGVLGEYFLETVLKNVLPPDAFKMQHKFANGEVVDALIITRDKNIPVDAKFSLENYNRLATADTKEDRDRLEKLFKQDLKQRIDETSKYIRPEEDTFDFAFMFIPADGLYYDLLVQKVGVLDVSSKGIIEYAFSKRVIIVSPTTLFAYLQTVLQGLRALRIEESAKDIQKNVSKLQKHLVGYEEHFTRVGSHLNRALGSYNSASDEFRKLDKDMIRITGEEVELATINTKSDLTLPVDILVDDEE